MVLTYNMIINRLDELNTRETQVRRFYKPLLDRPKDKPWPRRHRFADKLEPGDVVKTVTQSGDDWEEEPLDDAENQLPAEPPEPPASSSSGQLPMLSRRERSGTMSTMADDSGKRKTPASSPLERMGSVERFPSSATNLVEEPSRAMAFATDRKGQRIVGLASEHERALHNDVEAEVSALLHRDSPRGPTFVHRLCARRTT